MQMPNVCDFLLVYIINLSVHPIPCFYRAAWNADAVWRWKYCLSVCPSVCPSVKRVDCVQIFIPYERPVRL